MTQGRHRRPVVRHANLVIVDVVAIARRVAARAQLWDRAAADVDQAPPLTADQREVLAAAAAVSRSRQPAPPPRS